MNGDGSLGIANMKEGKRMAKSDKRDQYNALKDHDGQKYTGMKVGGKHRWKYDDGVWNETKVTPEKWKFEFACDKNRMHQAPPGTGALKGTEYHWYIIADQKVVKLDENTYKTVMNGSKFKIGYKKPHWRTWSYNYDHESYEDKLIQILQEVIDRLKAKKKSRELTNYF